MINYIVILQVFITVPYFFFIVTPENETNKHVYMTVI